jgi:hypothetical protein
LSPAAIAGATTTTTGWAARLVQTAQGDFVNSLLPNRCSAAGGMGLVADLRAECD